MSHRLSAGRFMSRHHDAARWTNHNQTLRKRLRATLPTACTVCGYEVDEEAGDLWDIDHIDGIENSDEIGVAHRKCNRSSGGRRGAAISNAKRKTVKRWLPW